MFTGFFSNHKTSQVVYAEETIFYFPLQQFAIEKQDLRFLYIALCF